MPHMPKKHKLPPAHVLALDPSVRAKIPTQPLAPPVILETENYRVRSLRPTDVGSSLQQWLKDKDVLAGLNIPQVEWSAERLQKFIASFDNRTKYIIGIFDISNSNIIGFYTVDVNHKHKTAQLTAAIGDKSEWGKNILVETAIPLVDHFFDKREVEKITARIISTNKRVFFNFMNSDLFHLEARLQEEILSPAGARLDVFQFAAFKSRRPGRVGT